MPKVWNRLQKIGKKAAKFNITLYSHELILTCLNSKWYPDNVRIIWSRKSSKKGLEFVKWEPNLKNIFIGKCHWNKNDAVSFDLTMYKSTNSLNENDFDLKEILIEIENEDKNGKRKLLANGKLNISNYLNSIEQEIKLDLKVHSSKVKLAFVKFKLKSNLLKEGKVTDEDMISLASFASSTITTPSYMTNQNDDSDCNDDIINNDQLDKWNNFKETIEKQELTATLNNNNTNKRKDSNNNRTYFEEQEDKQIEISKIEQNKHISFDKFEFNFELNTTTTESNKNKDYLDHLNPFNETSSNPFESNNDEERVEVKEMTNKPTNNELKEKELLDWCNKITGLDISDFSKSWKDGKAFYGIIKHYRPELVKDFKLSNDDIEKNLKFLFSIFDSEKMLVKIVDVNDLLSTNEPDRLLIMTFINELKTYFELSTAKKQQSSTPIKDSSRLFKNRSQFTNPFDESDDDEDLDMSSSIASKSIQIKNESFKERAIKILNQSKTFSSPNKSIKQLDNEILVSNDYISDEILSLTREQKELDEKAISLEKKLRGVMKSSNKTQEDDLIREWFLLVNRKNMLLHRQFELELLQNEKNLEKRYNFLTKELHTLSKIDDFDKTYEQRQAERTLLNELVNLVNKRNELVEQLDEENRLLESEIEIDDYVRNNTDLQTSTNQSSKQANCSIQ